MKRAISFLIFVYISVPVVVYLFPWMLGYAIYAHLLRFPYLLDLGKPGDVLNYTCNFYLSSEEGISVGVWHTLPASQWDASAGRGPEWYQDCLGDGRPVIIYLHGNIGTRALGHRVELVKILSAAGYHVLSLDYRGFGDSTGEPSESGLTTDALYLYNWAKQRTGGSLVCVWGHSLGTGVATNTAVKVQEQGSVVDALILEAPFTRMEEVVVVYPITKLYMFLPGFKRFLLNTLEVNNIVFASDENLKTLMSPLLILHSEDDDIVPYHMGQKLYHISLEAQEEHNSGDQIQMVSYNKSLGFSHNNIYLDPNLSSVVWSFLRSLRG